MTYQEILNIAIGWEKLMNKMEEVLSTMEKLDGGIYTFENICIQNGIPILSILYDNRYGSGIAHIPLSQMIDKSFIESKVISSQISGF